MLTAWNPADVPHMALPPCHCLFQFHVANGRLSCQLYQRSADIFLGVPFNIASYALADAYDRADLRIAAGQFVHVLGDAHLYATISIRRANNCRATPGELPQLLIHRTPDSIDGFRFDDFEITGYEAQPHIAAPIAV
jgi:thymidylate synthase